MGEGRPSGDASPTNQRLTVPEAAAQLGITEAAVRGRVKRGTLRSYREGRTVYVLLTGGESASNRDESRGESRDQSELVAVLREQLAAEREAHGETRRIAAMLAARVSEIGAAPETPQAPQTPPETSEGAEPRSDRVGPQEGAEEEEPPQKFGEVADPETPRRPWWVRILWG